MLKDPQGQRTAKALAGLLSGAITVTPEGLDRWRVRNGNGVTHLVARAGEGWTCDCEDFTFTCLRHDPPLRCYHGEAVAARLVDAAQAASLMKGETKTMSDNTNTGWTKVYHPSGLQVTIPLPSEAVLTVAQAKALLESVTNLLTAGWLVNAPGLDEGEKVETIGAIVRRSKANDDESETPVIDLYPERGNFRLLGIYLNDEAAIQAFEQACGVKLPELALYVGDNSIERGKGPKTDKFVRVLPAPVKVVFKANPKWEGEEDKKHPKRVFVRWMSLAPSTQAAPAKAEPAPKANGNGHGTLTLAEALTLTTPKGLKLGEAEIGLLVTISNYHPANETPTQAKLRAGAALVLQHKRELAAQPA